MENSENSPLETKLEWMLRLYVDWLRKFCYFSAQFHVPLYINHLIFFSKLCICLSALFSTARKSPYFLSVGLGSNTLTASGGLVSMWSYSKARLLFFHHGSSINNFFPLIKMSHVLFKKHLFMT